MIAYFARRIAGGAVTFLVVGFVLRSILLYAPGGPKEQIDLMATYGAHSSELLRIYKHDYDLEKPWPVDYLMWLFNPSDSSERKYVAKDDGSFIAVTYTRGINLFGIQGSGVLTGDLSRSMAFDRGRPVTDLFGKGLGEFMLLVGLTLPLSMAIVAVQRRRRRTTSGLPNYPQSRNLLHHYAHPMRVPGL